MPPMDDEAHDAGGLAMPDAAAVDPFLPACIAENVTPVSFVGGVDDGGIEVAVEHGERVADVVAGRAGAAAVLPLARLRVVDAEVDVPVVAGRLISAGTGLDVQRHSAAGPRIVQREDVAQRVVDDLVSMNP